MPLKSIVLTILKVGYGLRSRDERIIVIEGDVMNKTFNQQIHTCVF